MVRGLLLEGGGFVQHVDEVFCPMLSDLISSNDKDGSITTQRDVSEVYMAGPCTV